MEVNPILDGEWPELDKFSEQFFFAKKKVIYSSDADESFAWAHIVDARILYLIWYGPVFHLPHTLNQQTLRNLIWA